MNKIGVLTLPFGPNYGYILQAFALTKAIENLGYTPLLLSRGWNNARSQTITYRLKRWIYYNYFCRNIVRFFNTIPKSDLVRSGMDLRKICEEKNVSAIVCGSDQVWSVPNTRGADLNYFFDFLEPHSFIKRFSYAASFGKAEITASDDEMARISSLLQLFDGISVREDSGLEILKNKFGIDSATCVLDPTFLLSKDDYLNYIKPHKKSCNLLTTYILDNTQSKIDAIELLALKTNMKIRNLYNRKYMPFYSVEYWLRSINDADFVITDSFHGMVFSIIFQKNFYAIVNKKRGETRFVSLLSKLGLLDRLIYSVSDIGNMPMTSIDYTPVNMRLDLEKSVSKNILNDYLKIVSPFPQHGGMNMSGK